MATVEVAFTGGKQVDARIAGHFIPTDQSLHNGGGNAAPEPFQVFLASIATCAGIYAKSFCDQRGLSSPLGLEMDITRRDDGYLSRLDLVLHGRRQLPRQVRFRHHPGHGTLCGEEAVARGHRDVHSRRARRPSGRREVIHDTRLRFRDRRTRSPDLVLAAFAAKDLNAGPAHRRSDTSAREDLRMRRRRRDDQRPTSEQRDQPGQFGDRTGTLDVLSRKDWLC